MAQLCFTEDVQAQGDLHCHLRTCIRNEDKKAATVQRRLLFAPAFIPINAMSL